MIRIAAPALCLLALSLGACTDEPAPPVRNPGNIATAANGWYRGDLHNHTVYSGEQVEGADDVKTFLAIADAYRDPLYLAALPEAEGDGLDWIAITDHRAIGSITDADFRHDHLIPVPGEEYGGGSHANILGLKSLIGFEPADGQSQNDRHLAAIAEAHAQGAIFSVNHPAYDITWTWDMDGIDAIEVWNSFWIILGGELTQKDLDALVAERGYEGPYIRAAVQHRGGGRNQQALWVWYAMLSRGQHPAVVGGSDRHVVLPTGMPTTYVRKPDDAAFAGRTGKALGPDGIVAGIKAGGTFVSRGPHAAQVILEAIDAQGVRHPVGSKLPAPGRYTVHARVSRAQGGLLRLVSGPVLPGEGPAQPQASVVLEQPLGGMISDIDYTWDVPSGGAWLHALVLEPLLAGELDEQLEKLRVGLEVPPGRRALADGLGAVAPLVDAEVLLAGAKCDPTKWEPDRGWCVPADNKTLGTFYVPDKAARILGRWFENDVATDWCLGAVSSAFLARP